MEGFTMKAAIVEGVGLAPVYAEFSEPVPAEGEALISVRAAGLSHIVRGRATGAHYSGAAQFPFSVGIDGVGTLADGRRVYFVFPRAPFGSMAERTVASTAMCIPLPDALDDVTAAAIANPGMSSWAAYAERAMLKAGETVLINGATGIAGRLAVQIAKHFGAKKIIGTGRDPQALSDLAALGTDVAIPLGTGPEFSAQLEEQFAGGIDVVIDYLWGQSAEAILAAGAKAGAKAKPIRFVQVGSVSGDPISLSSTVLRSSAMAILGSGIGSISMPQMIKVISDLMHAAVPGGFKIATEPMSLSDIGRAWAQVESKKRIVLVP
jgi:NADPH:quinone reductase-like Zn-dependent oxidoreductase